MTIPYTFYDDELIAKAKELFHQLWRKGQPIRLMGVRLSELTSEAIQTNLFEDTGKKTQLYKAIDEVKGRFGKDAVVKAGGKKAERSDSEGKRTSKFIRRSGEKGDGDG